MIPENPFVLIDGSSYLYRAFYALPPLTNSKGKPTGAIYGVINMIRKLLNDYSPKHVAVVFDAKGKTFRDEIFKRYKENRPPIADDLRVQIQPLQDIVRSMGLPLLIVDGVEADDVIGTLVKQAEQQGLHSLISTGDKDMAQLVTDKVTLINTMSGRIMDPQGVKDKFDVPPERIIDYLSLMGDKSDNIPGIPSVGPKTAAKWLNQYGDLDGVIQHADEITGKVGEKFRDNLSQLALSKELATIKLDVELSLNPLDLAPTEPDNEQLAELYTRWEFKTWLSQLSANVKPAVTDKRHYQVIDDQQALQQWIARLEKADIFAFDTETTDLNYTNAEIVGLSFADKPGHAAYVPLMHDYEGAPKQLDRDWVLQQLKPLLEDKKPKIIGQHIKYDMNVLANYGIHLQGIAFDTMLESYVLNSVGSRHDMDTLAFKYLGVNTVHFEDIAGKGKKQLTFNQIDVAQAAPYAAEDADITLQLHYALWSKLSKHDALINVFNNIELPLVSILSKMECNGVLIDAKKLQAQGLEMAERLQILQEQAHQAAGEDFNLNSTKQLQAILFEKMQLPIVQKTPKGQPSTAESVLSELAFDYPLPKLILEYRTLSKLKSTYIDKLPLQINAKTHRVHTSYNQAVTATGRLSSSDPNLQNIPVRTEEGRRIRQAFIAPSGYQIVAADYSQVELRIMAHLSKDPGLLAAFQDHADIHRATAAEVFGLPLDKVSKEMRRRAKAINFGLIYGMSAFGLARQLNVERHEAQKYMDVYFERYPGVKIYMEETREQAREQGYVETLYGRRLYLPDIKASNHQRRLAAERAAINAPMQGTAADIMKMAMINVDQWLQQSAIDVLMTMQVHDELVFEVADDCIDEAKQQIDRHMCQAAELAVPLVVEVGVGDNWDEAH